MHPTLDAMKARTMNVLSTLALLLAAAVPTPTAQGVPSSAFVSRRATLKTLTFEDEAVGKEVQQIAIGSILLVVSFVIALVMYPILTSAVAEAQADNNSTASQVTLLGLLPTIFII